MHGLYQPSRLKLLQLVIVAILSFLIQCAFDGRLLFFDRVLQESVCQEILNASFWIILLLLFSYFVLYLLIARREKEYIAKIVYNNICKEVFTRFVKPYGDIKNKIKVSLLKAFNPESERPFLQVVGRYQTKSPKKKSKITFSVNEGCAGIAYAIGGIVSKKIDEFNHSKSRNYYQDSKSVFNLPENKARKLNDKACHFLCIPVRYFDKEDLRWGILSIDSEIQWNSLDLEEYARNIENVIGCYSAFFVL